MNNENSSKQILLSVLGIAILLIAVVGVSFAFFSYSRVGDNSNTITTGDIFFNFTDGNAIKLTNQFPIPDSEAAELFTSSESNQVLDFSVSGYNTSTVPIKYTITAIKGDIPTENKTGDMPYVDPTDRLADNDIKLLLQRFDAEERTDPKTADSINYINNYESANVVGTTKTNDSTALTAGVQLATGTVPANTAKESKQTDYYRLRMWISDATVKLVGSADQKVAAQSGFSGNVYTSEEFADKFYSLKLKVEANTTTP